MKLICRAALGASAFLLLAGAEPAFAQYVNGEAIAKLQCRECHSLDRSETGTKEGTPPAFAAIANMPSATLLSIKVFLRTPHRNMPDIVLREAEIDALVDYIMDMKRK